MLFVIVSVIVIVNVNVKVIVIVITGEPNVSSKPGIELLQYITPNWGQKSWPVEYHMNCHFNFPRMQKLSNCEGD